MTSDKRISDMVERCYLWCRATGTEIGSVSGAGYTILQAALADNTRTFTQLNANQRRHIAALHKDAN